MNSGSQFLDPRRSWFNFSVVSSLAAAATWGQTGGAGNIIERVVISTRSGVELSRLEGANVYIAKKLRYGCSAEFISQWGTTMGYQLNDGGNGQPVSDAGQGTAYSMPLTMLSPFFEGDGKTLVPPQIAAGLRVSITLASDIVALKSAAAATYTVSGISIQTSLTTLVDDFQRSLNQQSAEAGLVYPYCEIHTTQSSTSDAQTTVNIQVRKAVARALKAFTVSRTTASLNTTTADAMASEPFAVSQFQWRLGSVYFPHQPITSNVESFYVAQNAFDGGLIDCRSPNAVGFTTFVSGGDGIVSCNLERSSIALNDVLNISGMPTNNSRALDADITFSAVAARTTTLYMKHVKIARAFLENVVVSE